MVWITTCLACSLLTAGPPDESALPDGFAAHVAAVPGGRIDWTRGCILVEGLGRARGTTTRHKLLAMRAAELVAARNALALTAGVRIDADGRLGGVRDGSVYVEGVIRGHRTVRSEWRPEARPPEARVTLEVPLWGEDGAASLCWRTRRIKSEYGRVRVALAAPDLTSTRPLVVIDARGLDFAECLFPALVDTQGEVIYDIATLSTTGPSPVAPVRYATCDRSFERLTGAAEPGESQPTRPAEPSAKAQPRGRPDRDLLVVRAERVSGTQQTDLVLSDADARLLSRSPQAVAALRSARVIILVRDTPAAP